MPPSSFTSTSSEPNGSRRAHKAPFTCTSTRVADDFRGALISTPANRPDGQGSMTPLSKGRSYHANWSTGLIIHFRASGHYPYIHGDISDSHEAQPEKGGDAMHAVIGTRDLYDLFIARDLDANWTHAMISRNKETGKVSSRKYSRLDYILVDAEQESNIERAGVHRFGPSTDASSCSGLRYLTVDEEGNEARALPDLGRHLL